MLVFSVKSSVNDSGKGNATANGLLPSGTAVTTAPMDAVTTPGGGVHVFDALCFLLIAVCSCQRTITMSELTWQLDCIEILKHVNERIQKKWSEIKRSSFFTAIDVIMILQIYAKL